MRKYEDLSGKKFNRLEVIEHTGSDKNSKRMWKCLCDCGKYTSVPTTHLKNGNTKSCGCYYKEVRGKTNLKHGKSHSPEWYAWKDMIRRCKSKVEPGYKNYGGRGISVCEEWKTFQGFYDDMGDRISDKHSLDRIDNEKGYYVDNCRWTTREVQANNTRKNRFLVLGNIRDTVANWSKITGINRGTLNDRVRKLGWSDERALTAPIQYHNMEISK